jgi:hypothetical protein
MTQLPHQLKNDLQISRHPRNYVWPVLLDTEAGTANHRKLGYLVAAEWTNSSNG